MDLKFYLGVFTRRWWLIVLSTLLVSSYAYYKSLKEPIFYTAQSRLLYEANSVASSILGATGMMMPMSWNNPVDTQIQLITTRPNVEEVIRRLNLVVPGEGRKMTPDEILAGLSAEVDRNTDIILLRYTGLVPNYAVKIVNEMGHVFVERNKTYHTENAKETREFIEMQLAKTEKLLNDAEDELRRFREKNEVFSVGGLGQTVSGQLSAIDSDLIAMDVDRQVATAQLDDARRHLEITDPQMLQRIEKLQMDPVFKAMQSELANKEAIVTARKTTFTPDSAEVKAAEGDLTRFKGLVSTRAKQLMGRDMSESEILSGRTPTEDRYMGRMIDAQTTLAVNSARRKALEGTRTGYSTKFQGLPAQDQYLTQLERRRAAAEETYNVFLKRMQEVRITEAVNTSNVRIIEEAVTSQPGMTPINKTVGLASLLGLVFGLGIALLVEFLDDRIRRPEEAQNVLELPILGLLPWVEARDKNRQRLVVLEDPRSPVTESYRALQTYTRLVDPGQIMQCFMLTSPGPKEGKSTVLANLAVTSAQLGKRTLIIDTDLRAPSQHINFDRPNLVGISDVVYEACPLEEAIQPTDIENLDILCTGPVPADPVQTLHAESFKRMVERLKREYDAIFFDAPPINLFTDAAVLGRSMDSVLLVVDVRSTTRQSTLTAKELLIKARVPLMGMVVKNMVSKASRFHNRYFERYYVDRLKHLADD